MRLGFSLVLGTMLVGAIRWIDAITFDQNSSGSGFGLLIAWLYAPGLLLSYFIAPAGVHSGVNIVGIADLLNVAFYAVISYVAQFLIGRARAKG